MNSDNIINFPRNPYASTRDPIEIQSRLREMKEVSVEDALEFMFPIILETVESAGFEIKDHRKAALLCTLMRAIMYDHYDMNHPINNFIDTHADDIDEMTSLDSLFGEDDELEM